MDLTQVPESKGKLAGGGGGRYTKADKEWLIGRIVPNEQGQPVFKGNRTANDTIKHTVTFEDEAGSGQAELGIFIGIKAGSSAWSTGLGQVRKLAAACGIEEHQMADFEWDMLLDKQCHIYVEQKEGPKKPGQERGFISAQVTDVKELDAAPAAVTSSNQEDEDEIPF